MSVENTRMSGWVKLKSDADYNTLKTTGTFTQDGTTITYSDKTVYLTPDTGIGGTGLEGNRAVVTNASGDVINSGVSSTELSYLTNARKNLQEQIDDLYNKIGTAAAGVYVLDNLDQLLASTDTPGTYYIPDAYESYYQYLIDNDGKIQLIGTGIPPEEIGQQDLAAYQKKADTTLQVKDKNTNAVIGTVVGSINALDQEIGQSYPLKTVSQTVTAAINELADRESGNVQIVGANRISVTSTPLLDGSGNKYTISHPVDGTTAPVTYFVPTHGRATLKNLTTDAAGHLIDPRTGMHTLYIPTSVGTEGQVWTWDSAANAGRWKTITTSGSYSAENGITLDGTTFKHTNTGIAKILGDGTSALQINTDNQGHVTTLTRKMGNPNAYIDGNWGMVDGVTTAANILNQSYPSRLTTSSAIYDIMGGMRLRKCTQAEYDALATPDPNTVYVIVG